MEHDRPAWNLRPGQRIRRSDLHDRFGGNRQRGISACAKAPHVFVFSEAQSGEEHGYYEHWDNDGVYHYTGEGQRGHQQMVHGNRAIAEHGTDGRALRVFDGARGVVTYLGEFELDDGQPWYVSRAPETGGGPMRNVIIFRLRRLEP